MEEEQKVSVIENTTGVADDNVDSVDSVVKQMVQSIEESTEKITAVVKDQDVGIFSDSESDGGSSTDAEIINVAKKRNVFKFTARKSSRFLPSFHKNSVAEELNEETMTKVNGIIDQFPSVFTVHEDKSEEEDAGESTSDNKGNSSIMSALNSGWNGLKGFWS